MSSSVVCHLSTVSEIFSSETTGLIEVKFHVEPPWDGLEVKIYDTKIFSYVYSLQPHTTKHINSLWDILLSISIYTQHSGERFRTIGLLVWTKREKGTCLFDY